MIACDKIISAMDILSMKMTNTIATDVPIKYDDNKIRYKIDCYIFHTVLLRIMLELIITILLFAI